MKNIDTILDEFLTAQNNRLKQRTYEDYEGVIELFRDYLNYNAEFLVIGDERSKWEEQFEKDEDCFTKMFGQDKLDSGSVEEFLDYFIIRKVASGEDFMKIAVRVMKKLSKWLYENQYVDECEYDELMEYFGEGGKELPNIEKLADLIFQHAHNDRFKQYENVLEGYFSISDINSGELWLNEFTGSKRNIGPVIVTKEISRLSQKGWLVNLVIGEDRGKWEILESGNVYPH